MPVKKPVSISVVLSDKQPKKAVVRYNATDDNAAVANMYVDKAALATLGDPDSIKVTIEAA